MKLVKLQIKLLTKLNMKYTNIQTIIRNGCSRTT